MKQQNAANSGGKAPRYATESRNDENERNSGRNYSEESRAERRKRQKLQSEAESAQVASPQRKNSWGSVVSVGSAATSKEPLGQ